MSESSDRPGEPAVRRVPLHRNPWIWAFLAGIATLTAIRPLLRHVPPPPPVIGHVEPFSLLDQNGRPFGSSELRGRVSVVNFFFTRCTSICPVLMRGMAGLQERYGQAGIQGIQLVSISVDPAYDTPERLREYASRLRVDPSRWTLVTGDLDAVRKAVLDGFKVPLGTAEPRGDSLVEIAHTGKLVLVDPGGGIRGYYDSDASGLDEVFHRSQHVLAEAGG